MPDRSQLDAEVKVGAEGQGSSSPMDDLPSDDAKRRKIERGKKACMPCRSRKCKCGGDPPGPCPNCVNDRIECQWPTEDGRSSAARKERSRAKRLESLAVRGLGRPPPKAKREAADTPSWGSAWTPALAGTPGFALGTGNTPPMAFDMASQAASGGQSISPGFPVDFDPEQFILAMSSQLPTVEEGSALDETSPNTLALATSNERTTAKGDDREHDRVIKITWWRPHGPTAIAPGLKRFSLKVRVAPPTLTYPSPSGGLAFGGPDDLFGSDGMPAMPVMRHLLDIFAERFECQFPVLQHASLLRDLEAGSGSVFLFCSIAAVAARFSTHPAIAQPALKPFEYGNIFAKRAKDLLAAMLTVPSRETVMALILLAHIGFGNDSESEEWLYVGIAVRMSIDLGLHLDSGDESNIGNEDRRLNRLTFWSVALLDYALSFGVGRQTTFRIEEITQRLPTEHDVRAGGSTPLVRSPFAFAARQMKAYGPLINLLNGPTQDAHVDSEIIAARAAAVTEYHQLPDDMQWNVSNLQLHRQARQDAIFLHIHLWMHTIIASAYLTGDEVRRGHGHRSAHPGMASGHSTPTASYVNVWRNSARTIGDILVLSDVINPFAYLALPFANQALYVAGCCYIKELEQHNTGESQPSSGADNAGPDPDRVRRPKDAKQLDLFRSMLTSVATTSITTLQQGLTRQTTYWSGVAWVAGALQQRAEGIHADEVDIEEVQERLQTLVSMPDAGLVESRRQQKERLGAGTPGALGAGMGSDFGIDFNFLTLPFDLGPDFDSGVYELPA